MIATDVELREIRAFLVLAEELHFGRTAERLGLTPSRVSQTIRTLETRIGGRLFERTSRTVALTPTGEHLRAEVTGPFAALQGGVRGVRETTATVTCPVRIGMYTESVGGHHLVGIVRAFESAHPGASVVLSSLGLTRNYLEVLRAGEVDMLATRLPVSDPDVTVGPVLTHEPRVLLVAATDPLAREPAVTLESFADRYVSDSPAFPREMMDALIPPVTPSGRRYRRRENASIEDMLMSIATGRQVHPTVPSFLDYHAHPAVTSVPIRDLPPSRTALVWLTANRAPRVAAFALIAARVLAGTGLATAGSTYSDA